VFGVPEGRMKFPDDQPTIEPLVAMAFFMRLCMMGKQAGKKPERKTGRWNAGN
jgi:hypothetical protein